MRPHPGDSVRPLALLLGGLLPALAMAQAQPPQPFGALPTSQHLAWHQLEFYGFIHFTLNTFTDREWGGGEESPQLFRPGQLDADQWARVARQAGMTALILTAKHHDGFCLWPSKYTEQYLALGQRVEQFTVEARVEGHWQRIGGGSTIGPQRILRTPRVTADRLRVQLTSCLACPTLSTIEVYRAPDG